MRKSLNGHLKDWVLGALLAVALALGGAAWAQIDNRIERIENRLDQVQIQYSKIAVVESLINVQADRLERIEDKLDALAGTGAIR